jgi:hypothetical protein
VRKHGGLATSHESLNMQTIQANWPTLLKEISKTFPATGGLLSSTQPTRFEEGILTLEFPASSLTQKKMCESNGRLTQIQTFLSEQFSTPVGIKLEVAAQEQPSGSADAEQPKGTTQRRNELMNDPAVKTVLLGLDATITNIEEE